MALAGVRAGRYGVQNTATKLALYNMDHKMKSRIWKLEPEIEEEKHVDKIAATKKCDQKLDRTQTWSRDCKEPPSDSHVLRNAENSLSKTLKKKVYPQPLKEKKIQEKERNEQCDDSRHDECLKNHGRHVQCFAERRYFPRAELSAAMKVSSFRNQNKPTMERRARDLNLLVEAFCKRMCIRVQKAYRARHLQYKRLFDAERNRNLALFTPVVHKRSSVKTHSKARSSKGVAPRHRTKRPKTLTEPTMNGDPGSLVSESTIMPTESTTLSFNQSLLQHSDYGSLVFCHSHKESGRIDPSPAYNSSSSVCSECRERQQFLQQWSSLHSSSAEPVFYDFDSWNEFDPDEISSTGPLDWSEWMDNLILEESSRLPGRRVLQPFRFRRALSAPPAVEYHKCK